LTLEQWWGAVAGHVTEKEAEDAALKLRERASKAQGKRIASNKAVRTVPATGGHLSASLI
jgi:hypothetical protein